MFYKVLQTLFDHTGCQQKVLAHALGYNQSLISKWLHGTVLPSQNKAPHVLSEIAKFFMLEIQDKELRGKLVGTPGKKNLDMTDEVFMRLLFEKLSLAYWAEINGETPDQRASMQLFEPNVYMHSNWEDLILEISSYISAHHQLQKDMAVYVHVSDWRSKPWRGAHRFIEEQADRNYSRYIVDMVYEIRAKDITYRDLSDFASFSFFAKTLTPASSYRLSPSNTSRSGSSVWFQGYGAVLEYPINNQYLYFYVPEEKLSGVNIEPSNTDLALYTAETCRPQVILTIFLQMLERNNLYLINLSLAALLIPLIPGASPWHHMPAEQALVMEKYLSALQLVLKSKSFFMMIHEEEKTHILKTREVSFGPIRYQAKKSELLKAFRLLKNGASKSEKQILYSRGKDESSAADNVTCFIAGKDVLFVNMFPRRGDTLQSHMYLQNFLDTVIDSSQLTDTFKGSYRLGLESTAFWTLLLNTLEENAV